MNLLRKNIGRLPLGIWVALIALILISFAWLMQAYSLCNWESALKLGLQNGSFSGDAAERVWAEKEKGEAIADLIWPMPLTVIALIGIPSLLGIAGLWTNRRIYFPKVND